MRVKTIVLNLCGTKEVPTCPKVEIGSRQVLIRDDFGGKVTLTKSQFAMLLEKGKAALGA